MIPVNLEEKKEEIINVILTKITKKTLDKIKAFIVGNEAFFTIDDLVIKEVAELILLPFEELTKLVCKINTDIDYANKFKFKEGTSGKDKRKIKDLLDSKQEDLDPLDLAQVAIFNRYDNIVKRELMQAYGIMACPYCNASYIFNRGSRTVVQFDHFYPRSVYPIFSLCIYNLVPSCYACNNAKSFLLDEIVSPYSKKCKMEDTKFTYELDDKYFTNHNLKICTNTNPGNDKMFHITELYKRFDFEAEKIVESYLKYNTNFECIYKKLKLNDGFKEQIREILLHKKSNITSEDCLNEILLKFRSDIFNQIASKNE